MPRTRMDATEIAAFLNDHEVGVLGLATGDRAYTVPMSYAYDEAEDALYFRFGYPEDSRKRRYLEHTERASFVVMDDTEEGWTSVLADGSLTVVAVDRLEATILQAVRSLEVPFFDVHGEDPSELEFELLRLDPAMLSGVREGIGGMGRV